MNKAMLTVGIIILSVFSLIIINIISTGSSGSELDYYLVKETTEAAMVDAIDASFYRQTGQLRMDKDKFAESFLRRFADSVDNTREYTIGFYDMNETPPKVSVKVNSYTVLSFEGTKPLLSTKIDSILETKYKYDQYTENASKDGTLGQPIESTSKSK